MGTLSSATPAPRDSRNIPDGVQILGGLGPGYSRILTPGALRFIARLHRFAHPTRQRLLALRRDKQEMIDQGVLPEFLRDTREVRQQEWAIAPIPAEIEDRRVEITGPVERKMIINALNSGACVFMADFEDSHSPTWNGTIEGQIHLHDAVRKTITLSSPDGKFYKLNDRTAVLFVRPRGWHLEEKHVLIDGEPISASIFDFGLFFFHNAREQLKRGTAPYFYLPKLESHLEARLWNDVFLVAQRELGIPKGSIKATVLIETILAAFEMEEILYELRDHSAGLNCGRWDYIFSFIKKFRRHPEFVLPDRALVTMETEFLRTYSELLVRICHRRGAHAMGGMAAQIPVKDDLAANTAAIEKVLADKRREVSAGHDGTWVAHPGLVSTAKSAFNAMKGPNQIQPTPRIDEGALQEVGRSLLSVPQGPITEAGLRTNVEVSLFYLASWLRGSGCVPLNHLMEDAATVEISRAQIWQWTHHGKMQAKQFESILAETLGKVKAEIGEPQLRAKKFGIAADILKEVVTNENFVDFITSAAYPSLAE